MENRKIQPPARPELASGRNKQARRVTALLNSNENSS
jgi:hypothetical protein